MTRAPLPDGLHPLAYRRWKGLRHWLLMSRPLQWLARIGSALNAYQVRYEWLEWAPSHWRTEADDAAFDAHLEALDR